MDCSFDGAGTIVELLEIVGFCDLPMAWDITGRMWRGGSLEKYYRDGKRILCWAQNLKYVIRRMRDV